MTKCFKQILKTIKSHSRQSVAKCGERKLNNYGMKVMIIWKMDNGKCVAFMEASTQEYFSTKQRFLERGFFLRNRHSYERNTYWLQSQHSDPKTRVERQQGDRGVCIFVFAQENVHTFFDGSYVKTITIARKYNLSYKKHDMAILGAKLFTCKITV